MSAQPQFIALPDGSRRFAVFFAAQGLARGNLLQAHALAEEMNKCRRMVAQQARRLAAAGWNVLLWDLHGCGDSDADFADASWQGWCDELCFAAGWLRERAPGPLWIWGQRAGALLAAEVASRLTQRAQEPVGLLLWQPVVQGKTAAQQLLRLKVAAELIGGQAKGVMQGLRTELASGATVPVAGYGLRAALIDGLEAAQLAPVPQAHGLIWLEQGDSASPVAQRQLDAWRQAGVPVRHAALPGPAFWQTVEVEDAPAWWDATLRELETLHGPA